jgi:hypothetical protein
MQYKEVRDEAIMRVYLAGPNTQQQAQPLENMPVLLSFTYYSDWIEQYQPIFKRILVDTGAYSEFNISVCPQLKYLLSWRQFRSLVRSIPEALFPPESF